ncbi:hypothetical protein N9937_02215 [bacterium]|nr:hypothetical protein [bacterium]
MCGEYGEQLRRPHYHACLFGHNFHDRTRYGDLYLSETLGKLWPWGFSTIGELTFQSAAYTARYVMKKITGDDAYLHYVNDDGVMLQPEYTTMSRKPGLARDWYNKYKADVYPDDFVIHDGKKIQTPRYYDKLFELEQQDTFKKIKALRLKKAEKHADNNTAPRLRVREICQQVKLNQLKRAYHDS